jgi:hypothetical protein
MFRKGFQYGEMKHILPPYNLFDIRLYNLDFSVVIVDSQKYFMWNDNILSLLKKCKFDGSLPIAAYSRRRSKEESSRPGSKNESL